MDRLQRAEAVREAKVEATTEESSASADASFNGALAGAQILETWQKTSETRAEPSRKNKNKTRQQKEPEAPVQSEVQAKAKATPKPVEKVQPKDSTEMHSSDGQDSHSSSFSVSDEESGKRVEAAAPVWNDPSFNGALAGAQILDFLRSGPSRQDHSSTEPDSVWKGKSKSWPCPPESESKEAENEAASSLRAEAPEFVPGQSVELWGSQDPQPVMVMPDQLPPGCQIVMVPVQMPMFEAMVMPMPAPSPGCMMMPMNMDMMQMESPADWTPAGEAGATACCPDDVDKAEKEQDTSESPALDKKVPQATGSQASDDHMSLRSTDESALKCVTRVRGSWPQYLRLTVMVMMTMVAMMRMMVMHAHDDVDDAATAVPIIMAASLKAAAQRLARQALQARQEEAAARTIAAFSRRWLGRRTLQECAQAPSVEEDDASMAYSSDYEAEQSERYSYGLEDGTPSSASPVSAGIVASEPVDEEPPEEVAEAADLSPGNSPGASASVSGLSARSRSERILGSRREVCIVSELQWTIGDLRSRVAEHWGSRISSIAAAGGLQLKHKWTLEAAGLKDGDTVFATLRRPALYSSPGASAVALVHSDGSVRVWGDSAYGGDCSAVQEKLRDVQEVRVSTGACAAILADGSVVTWGDDLSGGDSAAEKLQDVVELFAFRCAFAAILADGSVVSWGEAASRGDSRMIESQLRNVQVISATRSAFAALLTDGSVVAWGDVACGGDARHVQERLKNVRQIEASERAFAAILADGGIVTWGDAASGGDSSKVQHSLKAVLRLKASDAAFAALLSNGRVVTWGDPGCGGDSSAVFDSLEDVQHIEVSSRAFAAVRAGPAYGSVVTWGDAMFGGDSRGVQHQLRKVQQVQASRAAFGALLADGGVITWGSPWPWFGSRSAAVREHLQDVMQIQAFRLGFAALRSDGQVVIWGAGNPCIGDLPREEFRHFASTRRACLRAAGPAGQELYFMSRILRGTIYQQAPSNAGRDLMKMTGDCLYINAYSYVWHGQVDAYTLSNARFWEDYYNSTDLAAFDWYGSWDTEAFWLEDRRTERLVAMMMVVMMMAVMMTMIMIMVLQTYLRPSATILVLGCGRSDLSERMYRAGYQNITNIDISTSLLKRAGPRLQASAPAAVER
eukprot:s1145_g4.t1